MSEEELSAAVTARKGQVAGMLSGDKTTALRVALTDPPVTSKSQETKSINCNTVGDVIAAVGEGEIDSVIEKLEMAECDILMKYIYKLLGDTAHSDKSGVMLKWHAKLLKKTGMGAIVRSMTDRKTV
ncbi:hypothetical protein TL16_g08849 [Triparma laevis f. inornata]|uniref:Actin-related protein 2/3 complex subunit 5 n=2 Tax=Triparma laevis TaxID=1534972 RepID=A0A9W6ZTP4_9STRA|nr:hypothetical protein TrLO_g15914 [Triparma laevis f. longispina]GMH81181.1 hypothetical protein TL16_g08849 [Triparma laevis f. inornata]